MKTVSGNYWRESLSNWAIPKEIVDQAPEDPWIHPPVMFQIPDHIRDSHSHQRAREAIPSGGSFLDIGCGGGIAAFAVAPPASHVIGVDHQPEMLAMFSDNANKRGVAADTFEGFWPSIASEVPSAHVVAAHHVVYNVAEIENFMLEMNSHAKYRVIIEMPQAHPLSTAAPLWKHFWNLDRPSQPTPTDLMAVLDEIGIKGNLEFWEGSMRFESDLKVQAHFSRIRLCLSEEREGEVLSVLEKQPKVELQNLATIWWDVQ